MKHEIQQRIANLRGQMKQAGVNAWYISGTDPHQSEYMPEYWQVRSYISGFTGSAGLIIIAENDAALWTDSRYFLQAAEQLDGTGIRLMKMNMEDTPSPSKWLGKILVAGDFVGVDESCLSVSQFKTLQNDLEKQKLSLKETGDLLDNIWVNRPPLPETPIFEHELKYAGLSRSEKIKKLRISLTDSLADATLLTALDDIAWTFNLRGQDVDFNPVFVAYAMISSSEAVLFIDQKKVPEELNTKLHNENIKIEPYYAVWDRLQSFSGKLMIDPERTNQALVNCLPADVEISHEISLPAILKAVKLPPELENIRITMKKDGVAMVNFLFWLDKTIGKMDVDEYEIAVKLGSFRSMQDGYVGASFYPIVGYKGNGAIVHRAVTPETAQKVLSEGMLLFDSGGQYLSGTTDITRTITLGNPTDQQKRDFTLVLKGMIALSQAKFTSGTKGSNLDILARKALWKHGLDYGHGTGHGIGYFLNVHEGPANIRHEHNKYSIIPGMIFSNEPGLYRENEYGIRIENVITCVESEENEFGKFYEFETLTLCPIDLNLIEKSLLTNKETDWINDYHKRCFNELSPFLDEEVRKYLKQITKPI